MNTESIGPYVEAAGWIAFVYGLTQLTAVPLGIAVGGLIVVLYGYDLQQ